MWAQPTNDECVSAINIPSVDEYCSDPFEFTNVNATPDTGLDLASTPQGCFLDHSNGVWFTFTPFQRAVRINVFTGLDDALGFDIKMSVFEGSCGSLTFVGCSPGAISDVEWLLNGLTLGQTYYLLVESDGRENEFQLCIDEFFSPPDPQADCPESVILCDKSGFSVANLSDVGDLPREMTGPCIDVSAGQDFEEASTWYSWTCEMSGTLTFTITPTNPIDPEEDIDFIVYRLPGGLGDCNNRIAERCMLSGETQNSTGNAPCFGPTGLRVGETDFQETAGCSPGDNNFLAPLNMVAGESYAVIINNFSQSGFGFDLEFGGTGTFLGPQLDYDFETLGNVIECDKLVEFLDASFSDTDPIEEIFWNFGDRADPPTGVDIGPHLVEYASFGDKTINLIVETERGCLVSETFDIFVEPCCDDLPDISISTDSNDSGCAGSNSGTISVEGLNGAPEYSFSINGGNFTLNTEYNNLPPGEYVIDAVDIKGCMAEDIVVIEEDPPLIVDAGVNIEVELGLQDTLNATTDPPNLDVTYSWGPTEGLDCIDSDTLDCPDPIVISPGTTTYTVTITDMNGCTSTDQVTVRTIIVRPIYEPNVITPDTNDENSTFVLGFGRQAEIVQEFCIFDRWGNQIYIGKNIELDQNNTMVSGWDGRFGSEVNQRGSGQVNPGVYVWYADVLFIDGVVVSFAGDVTVIK